MTLLANMSSVSQQMICAETLTDYKGSRRGSWHAGFYFFKGWDGLMSELIFPARSSWLNFFYAHKREKQGGNILSILEHAWERVFERHCHFVDSRVDSSLKVTKRCLVRMYNKWKWEHKMDWRWNENSV